jgi:hypothetical protein
MGKVRDKPLRIVLPVMFLALSLGLARLGELQHQGFVRAAGRGGEGLQSDYAAAANIDHAINAPALTPAWIMFAFSADREGFLYRVFDKLGWWYRVFLLALWFVIGYRLDRWRSAEINTRPEPAAWGKSVTRFLVALYGAALCLYTFKDMYNRHLYYATYEFYLTYFTVPVYAWGAVLIFAGLFAFPPHRLRMWRFFLGALAASVGIFECVTGVVIYSRVSQMSHVGLYISPIMTIVIFGVSLFVGGVYLFTHRITARATGP